MVGLVVSDLCDVVPLGSYSCPKTLKSGYCLGRGRRRATARSDGDDMSSRQTSPGYGPSLENDLLHALAPAVSVRYLAAQHDYHLSGLSPGWIDQRSQSCPSTWTPTLLPRHAHPILLLRHRAARFSDSCRIKKEGGGGVETTCCRGQWLVCVEVQKDN